MLYVINRFIGKYADDAASAVKATCSFTPDTPVATADGAEGIGDIDIGDLVLAYDEETDSTDAFTVTAVLVHRDPEIVHLTVGDERIETTPEHPFFTEEYGWVAAGNLLVGDRVRKADGTSGVVQAVEIEQRPQLMYNLTVAVAHTFFVGDGQWLVHNECTKVLAGTAGYIHKELPERLRASTVAVGMRDGERPLAAVYHRTPEDTERAVKAIRRSGYDVLDAPQKRGSTYHAERQLYAKGYTKIGISRQQGMCDSCKRFFARRPNVEIEAYNPPQ